MSRGLNQQLLGANEVKITNRNLIVHTPSGQVIKRDGSGNVISITGGHANSGHNTHHPIFQHEDGTHHIRMDGKWKPVHELMTTHGKNAKYENAKRGA